MLRITQESNCFSNILTKDDVIADYTYIVSESSVGESISPSYSRSVSSCLIYQKLFFFDEVENVWIDYGLNTADYPFITFVDGLNTADTDIGMVTIEATRSSID